MCTEGKGEENEGKAGGGERRRDERGPPCVSLNFPYRVAYMVVVLNYN